MDGTFFGVFAAILLIGALLLAAMTLTKKGGARLDVDKYRSKWLAIENQLKRDEVSSFHLSVLNADKLLDQALRERGVKGETMGERMKTIKDTWTNANAVWTAHKLRNQIAHESDVQVSYDDARRALASFKQALKDVGAI
jgi:transposase